MLFSGDMIVFACILGLFWVALAVYLLRIDMESDRDFRWYILIASMSSLVQFCAPFFVAGFLSRELYIYDTGNSVDSSQRVPYTFIYVDVPFIYCFVSAEIVMCWISLVCIILVKMIPFFRQEPDIMHISDRSLIYVCSESDNQQSIAVAMQAPQHALKSLNDRQAPQHDGQAPQHALKSLNDRQAPPHDGQIPQHALKSLNDRQAPFDRQALHNDEQVAIFI